jgi:hypothetical protein
MKKQRQTLERLEDGRLSLSSDEMARILLSIRTHIGTAASKLEGDDELMSRLMSMMTTVKIPRK